MDLGEEMAEMKVYISRMHVKERIESFEIQGAAHTLH